MAPSTQLSFADLEAVHEPTATASAIGAERERSRIRGTATAADRAALAALETALSEARASADDRPSLVVLSACLASLGAPAARPAPTAAALRQAREDWLRRLASACRSESACRAYRNAIDDLLAWSERRGRDVFEEATIVDYLADYQGRAQPAPATYYRRFVLVRRFLRWVSRRDGVPDPFLDLEPPPKPRQERDWLDHEEFRKLLDARGIPSATFPASPSATGLRCSRWSPPACVAPSCARSNGVTSSSTPLRLRCSSAGARVASLAASRFRPGLPASFAPSEPSGVPEPRHLSSAASPVAGSSRRRSPPSSTEPRRVPASRST